MKHKRSDKVKEGIMSLSAFATARQKVVERHGKNGVRLVVRIARQLGTPTAGQLREVLRDAAVWFSDEDFTNMVSKASDGDTFNVDLFVQHFIGELPSRRKNVFQVLWERLDKDRKGFVELSALFEMYDVTRHPDVASGRRSRSEVESDFFRIFTQDDVCGIPSNDIITKEELVAYYSGVSQKIDRNEDFELLIIRSFSLDRPKHLFAASDGAMNVTHRSQQGKVHPLYQTSASLVGQNCDGIPEEILQKTHNRTAIFTKHAPPFTGATTLNTSVTRPKI